VSAYHYAVTVRVLAQHLEGVVMAEFDYSAQAVVKLSVCHCSCPVVREKHLNAYFTIAFYSPVSEQHRAVGSMSRWSQHSGRKADQASTTALEAYSTLLLIRLGENEDAADAMAGYHELARTTLDLTEERSKHDSL
jgi:hypothetical protein